MNENAQTALLKAENEDLRRQLQHYRGIEQELRRSEVFNSALFEYSPATTVVVDRKGRVVRCNAAKRRAGDRQPRQGDIMYRDYAAHHVIDMHAELMACMETSATRTYPEMNYGAKVLSITISPFPQGAIIISQDVTDRVRAERDREQLIRELRRALDEVETLRELLPICASCKKIRDDQGYWNTIEDYFSDRRNIDFSHTMCPDCMQRLYPEIWLKMCNRNEAGCSRGAGNSVSI